MDPRTDPRTNPGMDPRTDPRTNSGVDPCTDPRTDSRTDPRTRAGYDAVASVYADEVGDELAGKPLDRALLAAFAETVAAGTVLDVGCGPGHVTAHLASRGVRAVGGDLSPAMCVVAARRTGLPFVAADLTALPVRSGALAGLICLYAVIHLDPPGRAAAYGEMARVLRPGGQALISFHTSSVDQAPGSSLVLSEWWGHDVDLEFRYLSPDAEVETLAAAGLWLAARLDRAPYPDAEHASQRSYLLVQRA